MGKIVHGNHSSAVSRFRSSPCSTQRPPGSITRRRITADLPEKNVFGEHLARDRENVSARARRVLIIGLCTLLILEIYLAGPLAPRRPMPPTAGRSLPGRLNLSSESEKRPASYDSSKTHRTAIGSRTRCIR
ncbi:hypothetical protein EVAR_81952_1 [Eumeta japonica]|uniref:Uncharacterized protein n=1 Tax=Eumeta variegata TaxID=151549 RepID=A0A4C1ZGW6_EUMVA|nr:hypothetical protein EVAR_81952_1 [Eumeta japonica]